MNLSMSTPMETRSYLALKETNTIRRGSLPFKKRRFSFLSESDCDNNGKNPSLVEAVKTSLSSDPFLKNDSNNNLGSDLTTTGNADHSEERIAALAMVAAAASANVAPVSDADSALPDNRSVAQSTASTFRNVLAAAAAVDARSTYNNQDLLAKDQDDNNKEQQQQKLKSLLTSPLPNGCHGKTARTNSYCRRLPCYKGSKYCKVHYQHYVVATEKESEGAAANSRGSNTTSSNESTNGQREGTLRPVIMMATNHQDKRYTGCPTETRCNATTTRGRDCSYCAVKDTLYCYLHADYDTNPSPRRGSVAGSTLSNSGTAGEASATVASGAVGSKDHKLEVASKRKSPSMAARRLSSTKNLQKHMADAPFPLLCSLGTDNWFGTRVIVSTGPLAKHVGVVEKWGNGWVSVRLPGVGLHNRRSFELYLHPDGNKASAQGKEAVSSSTVELFDIPDVRNAPTQESCLKGNEAPLSPTSEAKPLMKIDSNVHEVTPLGSCRVVGINPKVGHSGQTVMGLSSIMFPTSSGTEQPTAIPESPVPSEVSEFATASGSVADLVYPEIPSETEKLGNDIIVASSKSKPRRIKITVPKEAQKDVPLAETLMLAQAGRAGKRKLGLLFGTAALERSRRNIIKPIRYEDTGRLEKKNKKRSLESDEKDADSMTQNCKVRRLSDSVPSAVSSSDEESSVQPTRIMSV